MFNARSTSKSKALLLTFSAAVFLSAQAPDSARPFADRLVSASDPLSYYDRSGEGIRLFESGKYKEAEQALQESVNAYPGNGYVWLYLAMAKHNQGKIKEAISAYLRARELRTKVASWFIDYATAQAYAAIGEKEKAIDALEAVTNVFYSFPQQIYDKKPFASLRDDPRFKKLTGQFDVSNLSRDDGWRMDLDLLVAHINKVNPVYKGRSLPKPFMARYRKLRDDIPNLTEDQIYLGMVYMVAALEQGHTGLFALPTAKISTGLLPMEFWAFPDGVFIISTEEKYKELVGSQVLKVEDQPVADVVKRLEPYATVESPIEAMTQTMVNLRRLAMLRALGIAGPNKADVRLTVKAADGKMKDMSIGIIPSPQQVNNKLAPAPSVAPPMFLRDMKRPHWFERLPNQDAMYVQLNQVADAPDETLPAFGLRLRKALREKPVKHLIFDVRHNNGGTTQTYPELLRTLIAHTTVEGNRLYVLISRSVYSACANLVTDLERLGDATFVGEATSGFGNQHGDSSYFFLPYSGIAAQLSSAWWQYGTPFDKRRSLVPDIPVQLTAKDWLAGRDPVMDVVLKDMKRPQRPRVPDFP
jgi:tetratricopeptide (TPR) repeat protein